jgi:hypothetical protein
MRLKIRELVATILVAAIAVPYIGYLINDEMPFIKDPRGMSATGLVLGVVAFLVLRTAGMLDRFRNLEIGLAMVSLVLGVVALALAETAAAEVLLAVFMGSILIVWIVELMTTRASGPALATGPACGTRNRLDADTARRVVRGVLDIAPRRHRA